MYNEPRPHEIEEIESDIDALFKRLIEVDPAGLLRIHLAVARATKPVVDKKSALAG